LGTVTRRKKRISRESPFISRGQVSFLEFAPEDRPALIDILENTDPAHVDAALERLALRRFRKTNLVFNYPREQYAALDRGESASINARYLTLSADAYTDPSVETVSGESLRVGQTTKAKDPNDAKSSIIRFILDVGQFVGTWDTAILIGGADATGTVGTGKIIAAVNDLLDDQGNPVTRTGSTLHLVNWKLKHLDASEV
jgi:hypothetical protein